jgi:hypothetical protein
LIPHQRRRLAQVFAFGFAHDRQQVVALEQVRDGGRVAGDVDQAAFAHRDHGRAFAAPNAADQQRAVQIGGERRGLIRCHLIPLG